MEKNKKKDENKRSVKSEDERKGNARIKIKPEIVKNIPKDIGRHGLESEKDLNPEE